MGYKIAEIEGIGPVYADKLSGAGIATTDDLLAKCGSKKGRGETAEASGCSEKQLLEWANMADLMRIKGVGSEFSELLEASGVDTVKELATRNAANLAAKMEEVNAEKKLTRAVPVEKQVESWVEEAKGLDPMITH